MAKEFICANLDSLSSETLPPPKNLTDAKNALYSDFLQHRVECLSTQSLKLQTTNHPLARHYIEMARQEALKSTCWADQVGAVVVDQSDSSPKIVAVGHNGPVVPGRFCAVLQSSPQEIRSLLESGERLNFCQAIHDVASIVARAAAGGLALKHKTWYLSLEPCDNCANLLVATEPQAVYFSHGSDRQTYYDSIGLQRLLQAQIPTYFVESPE